MNPWDRQAGDTDESFLWFQAYRDATPPRRLDRVRTAVPGKVAPPLQALLEWHQAGCWADRASAWDAHLDEIRQAEREDAVRAGARAQADADEQTLVRDLRELALREVDKLVRTSVASDAETLRPGVILKLAELGIKLGRLQRGESTENTATSVDLSGVSTEALREARKLLLKKA
jgi:hypothetical protein